MKQVFKCDHCYETNEKSEVIESHEPKCTSNPGIKGCWTCVHHVDEGMPISGPMYICQKGKSFDDVDDFESNGGCEIWETDEDE